MKFEISSNPNDFLKVLKSNDLLPFQMTNKEYLSLRPNLVEWMTESQGKLKLSKSTLFTALHYLDKVMEKSPNLSKQLQLYSMGCIFLAAKANEFDEKIPFISEIKLPYSLKILISSSSS